MRYLIDSHIFILYAKATQTTYYGTVDGQRCCPKLSKLSKL